MRAATSILGQLGLLLAVVRAALVSDGLPELDGLIVQPSSRGEPDLQSLSYNGGGGGGDSSVVLIFDVHRPSHERPRKEPRIVYQGNVQSDEELPECENWREVCNKVDIYGEPWVEKQCRCPSGRACSTSLDANDGYTIVDKSTRQYKLCEPVKYIPVCNYFGDISWTIEAGPMNQTSIQVNCKCRPGGVSYFHKQQTISKAGSQRNLYSFRCSPKSRMRCKPDEPCRMFAVHTRRPQLEDVSVTTLCQCNAGYRCPRRHTDAGSLFTQHYAQDLKLYSGHCQPMHQGRENVYRVFQ